MYFYLFYLENNKENVIYCCLLCSYNLFLILFSNGDDKDKMKCKELRRYGLLTEIQGIMDWELIGDPYHNFFSHRILVYNKYARLQVYILSVC